MTATGDGLLTVDRQDNSTHHTKGMASLSQRPRIREENRRD
jgi:hypothetical protein